MIGRELGYLEITSLSALRPRKEGPDVDIIVGVDPLKGRGGGVCVCEGGRSTRADAFCLKPSDQVPELNVLPRK